MCFLLSTFCVRLPLVECTSQTLSAYSHNPIQRVVECAEEEWGWKGRELVMMMMGVCAGAVCCTKLSSSSRRPEHEQIEARKFSKRQTFLASFVRRIFSFYEEPESIEYSFAEVDDMTTLSLVCEWAARKWKFNFNFNFPSPYTHSWHRIHYFSQFPYEFVVSISSIWRSNEVWERGKGNLRNLIRWSAKLLD